MFVSEHDIHNVVHNHVKETYLKHTKGTANVMLWVEENKNNVFHYEDGMESVTEELQTMNIPFTSTFRLIGKGKACYKHGHQSVMSTDTTFGFIAKK